jgi:zinc protease
VKLTHVLFAAAVAVAASTGIAEAGTQVADYRLDNGLELVVIPDHRVAVVTHMVWYRVGSADETPGKSGLAHFLEHLMFKGTKEHPAGEFSKAVALAGGQENAFTSYDYTGYYQRVPSADLKRVMAFEADRMTGLTLTKEQVLPELQVVLEEQNQRVGNNPRARLSEQVEAALFLNHPYGRPVIGWRQEIEALTQADAVAFYKRFYGPNDAVVVIAGDVDPEQALAFAKDTYGKVARRTDLPPRMRPQEPPPVAVRSLTLADPRVELPILQRDYLVPSFHTAKAGQSEALEVLAHILGSGNNSRLYQTLVVDRKIAVSAGAWYDSGAFDDSKFGVYGSPRDGATLPKLEEAIDDVIRTVAEKGVTEDELKRSKTRLIADAVYAHDSQASMARWYGSSLVTGSTVADIESWPDRIRRVTADEVREAARQWLRKTRSVTGYLVKDTGARS